MMHPMNDTQRRFAEKNLSLVDDFLREMKLPRNQYYDIVIFGYLRAVQDYCESPALQLYSFSTIARKRMNREVSDYNKYLAAKKNAYHTVGLQDLVSENSDLCWEDVLTDHTDIWDQLKTELILHELAQNLPRREMRIIGMKLRGDKMHDIAKSEHLTFQQINQLLAGTYDTVVRIIFS